MKMFPLQVRDLPMKEGRGQIDWALAEFAYREYLDRYGGGGAQSLERLAERGGFGVVEMISLLCARIRRLEKEGE